MFHGTWRILVAAAVLALAAVANAQQSYPTRPIRLIVPWPPGGGVDTAARILSQPLGERLGQPVVVDNKPGVAGNLGTALAAKEPADGYTLLMGSLSPNSVNPWLYSKLGFEPIKDFEYVGLAYIVPSFLVVPANSPANSPKDLVAMAKANPGKLNFGSGGVGSSQHLFSVMFNTATGIQTVHVPYKGTAPAENGLIAGEIDYMVDPPTALPFVEGGRMKALAVASANRSPALPNVPTLDEVGIPNVHTSTWYGILAPAGTPKPIVDRLNREINAILKNPEIQARLLKNAAQSYDWTPEQFTKFAKDELERYKEVVRASGAKQVD
ncbi:MAG: tripartite tricarboxylate transporter substrate binding protein [Burkholderiales bacterium]